MVFLKVIIKINISNNSSKLINQNKKKLKKAKNLKIVKYMNKQIISATYSIYIKINTVKVLKM